MTIKEMAAVAGVSTETVRGKAKELYPDKFENGKKTELNHGQAVAVMYELRKKGFVQPTENLEVPTEHLEVASSPSNLDKLGAMVANLSIQMSKAMEVMAVQQNQMAMMLAGNHLPDAKKMIPAPALDPRAHIIKLANEYVSKTGIEHRDAYTMLYREFGYRTHCNAILSAKNRGMKIIDYIDSEGQIETLEAIALEAFAS